MVDGSYCTVRNLWIIHGGTGATSNCLQLSHGSYGLTLRGVKGIVYGDNSHCIDSYGGGSQTYRITIDTCQFWSYCNGYTSRAYYDGAAIRLESRRPGLGPGDWGVRIYGTAIYNSPHISIAIFGNETSTAGASCPNVEISYCSTYTDHRNDFYPVWDGVLGHSSANCYGILLGDVSGAKVHNNYISTGDTYGGGRGLMLESVHGTADNHVEIYDNILDIRCGPDVEYDPDGSNGYFYSWGIRIRSGAPSFYPPCQYIDLYNNYVKIKVDTSSHIHGKYGHGATALNISEGEAIDANINVVNNTFEIYPLNTYSGTGRHIIGDVLQVYATPEDETIRFRGNRFIGVNNIINLSDGSGMRFENDTLEFAYDTDNPVTIQLGGYAGNATNICIRDAAYDNNAAETDINMYPSGTLDICLQKTLQVYVQGRNGLPVAGATVQAVNNYGRVVMSGTTNINGLISGVVTYHYESRTGTDSLNFNDFTITAQVGSDNTQISHTVNSNATTPTVVLSNTDGGGTPPEDTMAPAAIDDLSAVTGTNAGEVVLSWTAPGDDGAIGTASGYDIRYSLQPITSYNFAYASQVTNPPSPLLTGSTHNFTVGSLTPAATYFFAIRSWDDADNVSMISNVVSAVARSSGVVDQTPPGTIDDLDAVTGANNGEIVISWTAPGDDGATGTATSYNIRYSLNPITAVNFAAAAAVTNPPAPQPSGTHQSFIVGGLTPAQVYYFAIRASDDVGNLSGVSNTTAAEAYFDLGTGDDDPPVTDDLMLYPEDNSIVASTRPTLQVVNVDANPQNVYHFEIAHDSFFVTLATSVNNIAQESGETTSWRIEQPLESGRVYYWRARANDGNFGAVFNFKVQPDAHAYPNPFIPGHHNHTTFTGIPDGSALHIMTLTGELVKSWSATGGDVAWDGTNSSGNPVASGVYLWYVADGDLSGKIIVKR
jgi:hypothetical protein